MIKHGFVPAVLNRKTAEFQAEKQLYLAKTLPLKQYITNQLQELQSHLQLLKFRTGYQTWQWKIHFEMVVFIGKSC